ncbi:MAG TPA: PAS domain S-box protein [Opitutaceae bacterium]|nr:PAS domain S-box protein [Opitutaceae bacterium]
MHAIVAMTDAQGVIVFANDKFCEISGYARSELVGQTHQIVNSGYHPPEFFKEMWDTINAGERWHGVFRNKRKDGTFYWVDSTIMPIAGEDGRPKYFFAIRTDITRLKAIEEQLGELTQDLEARVKARTSQAVRSENLFRTLLASVTDYHYSVKVQGGKAVATTHTPACLAVTGYTEKEMATLPDLWFRMVLEEDRPAVLEHSAAALEGRAMPPLENRIMRKDGQVRWIRDTIVVRRDESGAVTHYDGIIADITNERRAQEEVSILNRELEARVQERTAQLKAASEQFTLLFDKAPMGVSWLEFLPDGREVYHLNEHYQRIVGLSEEESRNLDNLLAVTHPDDLTPQMELTRRMRAGEFDHFSMKKRYVHKDGKVIWANLTVAVLYDGTGKVTQQFAMIEDITDQHRAETELKQSELRFRRYVENASEILYTLDTAGIVRFSSPSWTMKLGHPIVRVVGHPFGEFVHPDDRVAFDDYLRGVLDGGTGASSIEYRMRHLDGSWRWHSTSGSNFTDERGHPAFFGVGRDVSVRRRAQEELRAALAQREEMERIVNRSPSVVVLWRAEEGFPVEFVSKSIEQFGFTASDMMAGRVRFVDLVHPQDKPRVVREVVAHAVAGDLEYSQEYRVVTKDGEVRWIDDRTVIRVDDEGQVTHHEGLLTDITERKQAEEGANLAREREAQTARDVQRHLLPHVYPNIDEAEIGALYFPSRFVGGDYYDFFEVEKGRWGFAIADVSGKGAAAALIMAACRTALRIKATVKAKDGPAAVIREVNRLIQPDMPSAMFISLVYGILDLNTRVFTFCRAGHEPPVVIRRGSNEVLTLLPGGMAIGLDPGPIFDELLEESSVILHPRDLLVLYTDGITEAASSTGEEFGRERLVAALRSGEDRALNLVKLLLNEALDKFAPDLAGADDRTLLMVRPR